MLEAKRLNPTTSGQKNEEFTALDRARALSLTLPCASKSSFLLQPPVFSSLACGRETCSSQSWFPKCPEFTEKASHNRDELMQCGSRAGPKTVLGLHCLHSATLGQDSACSGCSSSRDSAHKGLQLRGQETRGQGNHPPNSRYPTVMLKQKRVRGEPDTKPGSSLRRNRTLWKPVSPRWRIHPRRGRDGRGSHWSDPPPDGYSNCCSWFLPFL